MKKVFLFLITGFEEIEALSSVDILRRAGVDITTVSLIDSLNVAGSHNITVVADVLFKDAKLSEADMLVIPGGTTKFNEHEEFKKAYLDFANSGKKIAAICAAPMVLGGLGLLNGKKATAYPGFEKYLNGAILATDQSVVVDGQVTTGKGPGFSLLFALELVDQLLGKAKRDEVAKGLLLL